MKHNSRNYRMGFLWIPLNRTSLTSGLNAWSQLRPYHAKRKEPGKYWNKFVCPCPREQGHDACGCACRLGLAVAVNYGRHSLLTEADLALCTNVQEHIYIFLLNWYTVTAVVLSGNTLACNAKGPRFESRQWRRAIEALEARAPPDGVATLVNSLQNRVKSITLCVILNAKNGK